MDNENKNYSFNVSESKLVYSKDQSSLKLLNILIKFFTAIFLIGIMCAISYGFIKLFKLNVQNGLEQSISVCSAIITFACAFITITTLMADRQLRIYDDSLHIFNELNCKKSKDENTENGQQKFFSGTPLHRWYFIRKFKTYRLKNRKKMYSNISDANITFYFDKKSNNRNLSNSIILNIPLTTAEWSFFKIMKNYVLMLFYQKYCLFEFYITENKNGLLMWETVLSLYKSVLLHELINAIRLINILCIPIIIVIAAIV